MDKNIRDQWTTALRSGEYVQGHGSLQYDRGDGVHYCCLGVLCDIAANNGVDVPTNADGWYTSTDSNSLLDPVVREWSGMLDDGNYSSGGRLYQDNDNGISFNHIADTIEKEF